MIIMSDSDTSSNHSIIPLEMDMDPRVAKRWAEDYPWLDFSRRYYARKGCKVCNQSITGGNGSLKKHQTTRKHIAAMVVPRPTYPMHNDSITMKLERLKDLENYEKEFRAKMCSFFVENNIPFRTAAKLREMLLSCKELVYCLKTVNLDEHSVNNYIKNMAEQST